MVTQLTTAVTYKQNSSSAGVVSQGLAVFQTGILMTANETVLNSYEHRCNH